MSKLLWIALFAAVPLAGCGAASDDEVSESAPELNVNSRYTIEGVHISGRKDARLSRLLQADLDQVVGEKLDNSRLEELARRIKKELHVPNVTVKVGKGGTPEHVVVNFEISGEHDEKFDLDVAKFVYHSRQGWSGEGTATTRIAGNAFIFGLVSDNDALAERYAGIRAGYERKNVGTDRLRLRFLFSSFHEQWNGATFAAASPAQIYRTRQSFVPEATVVLVKPLEWSFGVDFSRYRPIEPAARTESSNAVVTTLRYHQRWGSDGGEPQQDLRASYSLRAATHVLESDPVFVRQSGEAHYRYRRGHSQLDLGFLAGRIAGFAPLFERFVLGNSRLLRGWNKFDLAPAGGSHVAHGSIDYSYRGFLVFYDTGAVWDRPEQREQKQSLGVGFRTKDGFQLAVAFPVRAGHADPVFYAGVGF